ncbi:MAG: hypothetical protein CMP12_09460 [Zunongwangia sp.]|jgi:hypothetical protein|uniref:Secreted protein n=3 Tax=Zunongwangia profunda TaxID=398743 RepID=D5BIG6_ZUNPS|nr:DUF6520 family protein [Zunongwangia profunda]MAC65983.1 hypothetical protein [Flavobacteriaceae bacterium]MAO36122.1 hypothetical protein [Zunongwangia sp.]ADF53579.1 hypothetical protein ZPR_3263 [Zunongwangia profunda SM-A87]MAS71261.1 hypothetical protein [Zunongwangia sp.]MCC4228621.1 DUF6520 family protein [Zunongwangia profunda]|tara:strand:- start:7190 stop:7456 length:267 start_codon:yes stop_codon:yes gene_type:complete
MKTNFLIPALAFVSAIGMSFTAPTIQQSGEVFKDGTWQAVPVNCNGESNNCQVRFTSDPTQLYDVYDSSHENILQSSGQATIIDDSME